MCMCLFLMCPRKWDFAIFQRKRRPLRTMSLGDVKEDIGGGFEVEEERSRGFRLNQDVCARRVATHV